MFEHKLKKGDVGSTQTTNIFVGNAFYRMWIHFLCILLFFLRPFKRILLPIFFFNPSKRYCSQVFFFECQLFQVSPVRKNYETFCARGSALKSGSWRDSVWESIAPFPQLNQPVTASWSTHQTSHPLIKVTATQTLSTDASNCQRFPPNLTHCGQPVSMLVRFFATKQNMAMAALEALEHPSHI